MFVREQLEEMFKDENIEEGGYKVITTLDYELQASAEEIIKRKALTNTKEFNASNAAMVAIEPSTGNILTMVGSRDYFDKEIEGNYNIATALRQPGSSFKPVVYAAAFEKGYQPETVLFDVPTEFSPSCKPSDPNSCYNPANYDQIFRGPINLRNALAQSINIPAVKLLYLVGINSTINLAEKMGITTLTDPRRYGLSLVLGGGEVKLLDMVGAYATFAADGMHYPYRSILEIQDKSGKVIYKAPEPEGEQVISNDSARKISSILSDNIARTPLYGSNSTLHFPGKTVAAKTGTTNDYRDAWIIGYTPYIAVGTWAGNNDNSSMEKKISGLIVAPMWNEFMQKALAGHNNEPFQAPDPLPYDVDPVIAGNWQANGAHTILQRGDSQYNLWEQGIQDWLRTGGSGLIINNEPTNTTNNTSSWSVSITAPSSQIEYNPNAQIPIVLSISNGIVPERADVYLNNKFVGSFNKSPFVFSLTPNDVNDLKKKNTLKVSVYDSSGTRKDAESILNIIQ
jgi:membrane peptidoglycan carboxypeptidase